MSNFLACFISLVFLPFAYSATVDCPFIPHTLLHSGKLADIIFETDSKKCTDSIPNGTLKTCSAEIADVTFGPDATIPNGTNVMPYIDLSVNVIGNEFISDIFVQLECLYAPNKENSYCHNHSVPILKWGKNYWPCRHHKILSNPTEVKLPIIYEHACFRMHGLSHYKMHITFLPQNCQLQYTVTLPHDFQLDPTIALHYKNDSSWKTGWSPMLTLDENDKEFVKMHVTTNPSDNRTHITMAVYQKFNDGTKLIYDDVIAPPDKTIQFHASAGDYHAFAYVKHQECRLICNKEDLEIKNCEVCNHTYLNFTLSENHLSGAQSLWKIFTAVMTYLMYLILILLAFTVISAGGIYVYYQIIRPKRLARLPPQAVEMAARPKVLIIYSDDCIEHCAVVAAFAELLQQNANAQIMIDTHNLTDPSIKPSLWLLQAITDAQYVIIIFSEASSKIMSGEMLISRRPFPELFNSAVRLIISKINDILSREGIQLQNNNQRISPALSKFIISRFSYTDSNSIPEYFSLLPCRRVVIPKDLGLLFGYLHGIDVTQQNSLEFDADLVPLNQAILAYQQYIINNPDWLQSRFESNQNTVNNEISPREVTERLPLKSDNNKTDEEMMEELATKYNISIPKNVTDDDEEEDEGKLQNGKNVEKYKLIGDLDDISSASSDD
uniref:SEFIR domain-containing protein n=1 Tax=Panagrolaimus sp. PS1159 TaxID=55785 RepID=A0AC35G701_9BILA